MEPLSSVLQLERVQSAELQYLHFVSILIKLSCEKNIDYRQATAGNRGQCMLYNCVRFLDRGHSINTGGLSSTVRKPHESTYNLGLNNQPHNKLYGISI